MGWGCLYLILCDLGMELHHSVPLYCRYGRQCIGLWEESGRGLGMALLPGDQKGAHGSQCVDQWGQVLCAAWSAPQPPHLYHQRHRHLMRQTPFLKKLGPKEMKRLAPGHMACEIQT